jgi:hypothetical protein
MQSRLAAVAALLFVAGLNGCASAPTTIANSAQTSKVIEVTDNTVLTRRETATHEDVVILASPDSVLSALRAAYADIGVEVKYYDPATREIGNLEFVRMRKMAGEPLTTFVNCGSTVTGLAADSYRITMLLVSTVKPEGSSSRVETRFQSRAEDPAHGTSAGANGCQSLGTLEQRLHTALRDKLGR